jgi:uncharacterized protein YqfA (UPF0365 family)
MTWALAALAFAKRAGSGVLSYLSRADAWQLVSLGLAALLIVQHFSLVAARHDAARWHSQSDKNAAQAVNYRRQLNAISTKRNEQAKVTTRTVEKVVQGQVQIRTIVQHIHDAPNPPDCGTPALGELRNEL